MAMILLAVEDAGRDAAVRDLLTAEGWWVTTVGSQEEALRAAADHAPQLLIVDPRLAQAGSLVRAFARRDGGPGVLLLVDTSDQASAHRPDGEDGCLLRSQSPTELLARVRRSLETLRGDEAPPARLQVEAASARQLTATDLFGDILEHLGEVGSAAPAPAFEPIVAPEGPAEEAARTGGEGSEDTAVAEPQVEPESVEALERVEPETVEALERVELEMAVAEAGEELESEEPESTAEVEPELGTAEAAGSVSIHEVLAALEEVDRSDDDELDSGVWFDAAEATGPEAAPPDEAVQELAVESDPAPVARVAHDAVGPYRLLELLEFGDLTERWLAVRRDADERVVVERIRHELRDRADVRQAFVDGHAEAAGWEHDSIVRVLDLGREGEVDYVVTEHCPGHSLREVLARVRRMDARMPLGICLLLVERLASALQAIGDGPAASRHGWVVPGSVWLGDDGRVLLREFGCGRLGPVDEAPVRDWRDYRFLAPEFWTGRPDIRSDLYSLGAILYEMVSTHPVHDGEDLETLKLAITTEDVTSVQGVDSTIPSEVDAWIMRLLRRSVEDRPPAVMEILSKVDLALQALPARPGDAEMSAYLRQLFTARMPEIPEEDDVDRGPGEPIEVREELEAGEPAAGWRQRWWWLLVTAIVLALAGYLLWGVGSGDGEPASEIAPTAGAPAAPRLEPAEAAVGGPSITEEAAAQEEVPPPAAPVPEDDLDVAGLVAEEFARRQRDLEDRLRAQAAAQEAAEPPADGPPPAAGDDGGGPARLQ